MKFAVQLLPRSLVVQTTHSLLMVETQQYIVTFKMYLSIMLVWYCNMCTKLSQFFNCKHKHGNIENICQTHSTAKCHFANWCVSVLLGSWDPRFEEHAWLPTCRTTSDDTETLLFILCKHENARSTSNLCGQQTPFLQIDPAGLLWLCKILVITWHCWDSRIYQMDNSR